MPKIKKENNIFDYNKSQNLAGVLLYGILKDHVPEKDKTRLFEKIFRIEQILSNEPELVQKVYDDKYVQLAQDSSEYNNDHVTKSDEEHFGLLSDNMEKYYDSVWDKDVKDHKDGLRELAEIMGRKSDKIKFRNESERNFYDAMQVMLQDMATGSLRDRMVEDPIYTYPWNIQVKMSLTSVTSNLEDGKLNIYIGEQDDMKTLEAFAPSGIFEAMAGALDVDRKFRAHIEDGSVSRNELIVAMKMEQARMEKALNISKEDFAKMKFAGATQNDRDEFTNGPRGYINEYRNLEARIQLLEAGWPAADVPAMAGTVYVMDNLLRKYNSKNKPYLQEKAAYDKDFEDYNKMPEETEEQKKAKQEKRIELNKRSDKLRDDEETIKQYKEIYDRMKENWDLAVTEPVKEEYRSSHLANMKIELKLVDEKFKNLGSSKYFLGKLQERLEAKPTPAELALTANDEMTMYKQLNAVDPTFMSSSKQFSDLKKAMKVLAEMGNKLSPDNADDVKEYTDQVKKTAKLAATYLRYKHRQAKGPDRENHKRSDTEKQRVQTVDNILENLKRFNIPGEDNKPIIDANDPEYAVMSVDWGNRILGEYTQPVPANKYDKYMQLHTGVGVINGTREEMIDDLAKIIGAHLWKKHKPAVPFDEKKVEAFAKQAKEEMGLKLMSDNELRRALVSPASVGKVIDHQNKKIYGLTEPKLTNGKLNDASYSQYIKDMQTVYKNMIEPEAGNAAYKKVYESVKKIAHLPESLEGVNFDKVNTVIANANHDIMVGGYKYFKASGVGKKMVPSDSYVFVAMNVVSEECTETSGFLTEARNTVNRRRGVKEVTKGNFDITNPKCIDIEKFTTNSIRKLVRKNQNGQYRRQLDPELAKEYAKNVRQTIEDTQKNMAKDKNTALAAGKSKEAPVKGSRKSI